MNIQSKFFLSLGVLLIIPLVYLVYERTQFVLAAQRTIAVVSGVSGQNTSCGSRRSRHACTKYTATLRYDLRGLEYRIDVSAGSQRGHNQRITLANYQIGHHVYVRYDPRRPTKAYRDEFWDIWGAPLVTLVLQITTSIAGFGEQRKYKQTLKFRK